MNAYLRLIRLPNLFTAMADVAMGFLFVRPMGRPIAAPSDAWALGLLMAASGILYAAGTTLNDLFDLEIDRRERPERPLPSGRISPRAAGLLGWTLLVLGVAVACGASALLADFRPAGVAAVLALTIVLYDAALKRTPIGPVAMGACRMLNVLVGMSVADRFLTAPQWLVAGAIGLYVIGVTWFARTEHARSSRLHLGLAIAVMLLGIALLAGLPHVAERLVPLLEQQPQRWTIFMAILAAWIAWQSFRAVLDPSPLAVRLAVRERILSLVVLDAAACYAVQGTYWAVAILLLLAPAFVFSQWMEST